MKCNSVTGAGIFAIVCGQPSRSAIAGCIVCGSANAGRLCDGKLDNGRTCDAPLCATCAYRPRKNSDVDYCPKHTRRPTPASELEDTLTASINHAHPTLDFEFNPLLVAPGDDGLINELTWSKSRAGKLEECPRQYFKNYYGAWGGWDRRADPTARRLYMLKHLSTRASWVGHKVHEAAKKAIKREVLGDLVDAGGLVDETIAEMKRELAGSKRGTYRQVKKGFGLLEHELGFPSGDKPKPTYFEKAFEMVAAGIRNLLASSTYALATVSPRLFHVDELDGFQLAGTKIYVAPDLAFERPLESTQLEMVDWKTGSAKSTDAEQLVTYAAFAKEKWNVEPENVVCRLVYTAELEEPEFRIEQQDIVDFKEQTLRSIAAMRALHGKPEEAFPQTTNTKTCEWCAFRGECWPNGVGT